MENNIKPIVEDPLYRAFNFTDFTDWISDEYGEMKCFLAYVDDNDALTRINEIKANFDENATTQYLELQVSFDKEGIIREVIMLIQEKIGDEWTDPERIGGHFFDSKGNVIGHEFLSEKEFAELETLARQAYAAKYLIDTNSYDENEPCNSMIKKGDKLIIVCEALQDEISDTVLVKLNSSAQSSMVMLTENVKKAPDGYCVNVEDIQALPSVTPTRKTGKWIDTGETSINRRGQIVHEVICSECNGISYFRSMGNKYIGASLCPNCGSRNCQERLKGESNGSK